MQIDDNWILDTRISGLPLHLLLIAKRFADPDSHSIKLQTLCDKIGVGRARINKSCELLDDCGYGRFIRIPGRTAYFEIFDQPLHSKENEVIEINGMKFTCAKPVQEHPPKREKLNASSTWFLLRDTVLKKWPEASMPSTPSNKDLGLYKKKVMVFDSDTVREMVKMLVTQWDLIKVELFPNHPHRVYPMPENLWLYATDLAAAIGRGFYSNEHRENQYQSDVSTKNGDSATVDMMKLLDQSRAS